MGISSSRIPQLPDFDSNVITPGTAFMARLAVVLRDFLQQKILCDPDWRHVQVPSSPPSSTRGLLRLKHMHEALLCSERAHGGTRDYIAP